LLYNLVITEICCCGNVVDSDIISHRRIQLSTLKAVTFWQICQRRFV